MESTLLPPAYTLSELFNLKEEIHRIKILALGMVVFLLGFLRQHQPTGF